MSDVMWHVTCSKLNITCYNCYMILVPCYVLCCVMCDNLAYYFFYEMLHGMCVISVLFLWAVPVTIPISMCDQGFVTNHSVLHMIYYVLHVTCVMLCKSFIIYEETGDQELCSWFFLFHFRIRLGFFKSLMGKTDFFGKWFLAMSLVEIVPGKSLSTPPFCVTYDNN